MILSIIDIKNVSKKYVNKNTEISVLNNINLGIEKGEFITIVGKSGCGKSTLLKMISGMIEVSEGEIIINNETVKGSRAECSIVFQDARLLPWMKIKENVSLGLENNNFEEKKKIIDEYIELVGLKGFENMYPKQLSGGMAQRAAIARGLAVNSEILLFDEPFGALDAMTKIQMQEEVKKIKKEKNKTMILVTHDIEEAVYLGDRVVVMSERPGKIRDIVKIDIQGNKDRTNTEFLNYKNKIHEYFFENKIPDIEYKI
jgi:hypothetical protein